MAETPVGARVFWIDFDGLVVGVDSLVQLLLVVQVGAEVVVGDAEVDAGIDVLRVDLEGLAQACDRLVEFPLTPDDSAEVAGRRISDAGSSVRIGVR